MHSENIGTSWLS